MDLVYDRQNRTLVQSLTNQSSVTSLSLVLRDVYNLSFAIVKPDFTQFNDPWSVQTLAGESIIMAARATVADTEYLIFQDTFVSNGETGDAIRYVGNLNLNTTELIAAVAAGGGSITIVGEITIEDTSTNQKDTGQFSITVIQDVIRDDGAQPPLSITELRLVRAIIHPDTGDHGTAIYNDENVLLVEYYPS